MTSPRKASPVSHPPTAEQSVIVAAVSRLVPGRLLKIQARAGTGKTSTLELIAQADPNRSMLYLAYNKAINAEAKKRFPAYVVCQTTHGLAWTALGIQHWIETKGAPRNVRGWEVESWLNRRRWHPPGLKTGASQAHLAGDLLRTVRAFMQSASMTMDGQHLRCVSIKTCRAAFTGDQADEEYRDYRAWLLETAGNLWKAMIDQNDREIPLEHDAYLKLFQSKRPRLGYDLILMDEAQDANPCTLDLFLQQRASALVMVGDEFQAIYGFRGAVDALQTSGDELPLTQSFRFGSALAEQANQILAFRGKPFAAVRGTPGVQSTLQPVSTTPYAVLCRSNRGVFENAISAANAGLRINSGAKDLEESILYVESAWALFTGHRLPKMHAEISEFKNWETLERESQSDEALRWLIKLAQDHEEDMPDLCDRLRAAKTRMRKSADVWLVTAHKSKGLEFDRVVLADDFAMLDRDLKAIQEEPDPIQQQALIAALPEQELHLLYVAATRAKHELQPNRTLCLMKTLPVPTVPQAPVPVPVAASVPVQAPAASSATAIFQPDPDPAAVARLLFIRFPPGLQHGMRLAATRNAWTPEDWTLQVGLVQDAMRAGRYGAHELASAYTEPPPPFLE